MNRYIPILCMVLVAVSCAQRSTDRRQGNDNMADNYLERRSEEVNSARRTTVKRINTSLDSLLIKNRSTRGYDKSRVVSLSELEQIVAVNTRIPSAMNQQVLRFKLITKNTGADKVLPLIRMGGALPDLHLPLEGTEPEAFIVICTSVPETRYVDMDLGISLQSMLLKATDMGLNGVALGSFNKDKLAEALKLQYEPLLVLAIGKSAEKIQLLSIKEGESHKYYRKDGIHYVPKVQLQDLIIK